MICSMISFPFHILYDSLRTYGGHEPGAAADQSRRSSGRLRLGDVARLGGGRGRRRRPGRGDVPGSEGLETREKPWEKW